MADLDQVLASVTEEDTIVDSVLALLAGVEQQLKDALAGITLPPGTQAKIDAVFDKVEASKAKLATALVANTPQA